MNRVLAILVPLLAACTVLAATGELAWQDGQWVLLPAPSADTPAGQVAMIRREIDLRHYSHAVSLADHFLKTNFGDPLREQVYDLAGQGQMRRGLYWQAYQYYDKQLKEFPSGSMVNRAVDRESEIAKAFLAGKKRRVLGILWLDAKNDGIDILQKIPQFVPGSVRAENALLTAADWYFDQGKSREAAAEYDAYLRLFPYTARAAFAEFRAAESLRKAYRGSAFEDTTLVEAQQRFKAFAEHRPAAAAETHVDQILKNIRAELAQKQFWIAQFYVRTGYEDSAAYYYHYVVSEYGDTNWGMQARTELGTLKHVTPASERPRRPQAASQKAEGEPTTRRTIVFPPEPKQMVALPASVPARPPAAARPGEAATSPASEKPVEVLPSGPEPAALPSEGENAATQPVAPIEQPSGGEERHE